MCNTCDLKVGIIFTFSAGRFGDMLLRASLFPAGSLSVRLLLALPSLLLLPWGFSPSFSPPPPCKDAAR